MVVLPWIQLGLLIVVYIHKSSKSVDCVVIYPRKYNINPDNYKIVIMGFETRSSNHLQAYNIP